MTISMIPSSNRRTPLTFALRREYVSWTTRHNGVKGFIAGMLQAFGGSFGAWLLWKLFSNPMQLSFPNADFFVKNIEQKRPD